MCAREDGIGGSKDLRAEIGKFPNSTNERKKMSNKTMKQRIAVVAASALTAGFLSVVSIPAANAGDGAWSASTNSVGVISGATPTSGTTTTHTATMLTTGTLNYVLTGTGSVIVSAGAVITSATTTSAISTDQRAAYGVTSVGIKPVGAAGTTFTVSGYADDSEAALAGDTAESVLVVTIASTSASGTPDATESTARWATSNSNVPTSVTSVTNASAAYNAALYLYIDLEDVYGDDIDATTGTLVVTASGDANVGAPAASGSATTGTSNVGSMPGTAPSPVWAVVTSKTAGVPWSGTVTVSYNGVTVKTASGKITGSPSKITMTPYKAGKTGSANEAGFLYKVEDAAGNGLAFTSSNLLGDTSSSSSVVSSSGGGAVDAAFGGAYGDYVGTGTFTCGVAGTSNVTTKLVIAGTGITVKSAPVALRCAGAAYSYSASLDKASYVQGEVATLTVTFKDSAGNLANSFDAVDAVSASLSNASLSMPMMALVGNVNNTAATTGATLKPKLAGTAVYTFTVGTATGLTAGSYNGVINYPTIDVATNVAYKVTTGGSSVTNEDVLKSIVALIASINKQIQALQKLILKR